MIVLDALSRVGVILSSSVAAMLTASMAVSVEHAQTIAIVGGMAASVAAVIAWVDTRIERRLRRHEEAEFARDDARHDAVMAEIAHVRRELRWRLHDRLDDDSP